MPYDHHAKAGNQGDVVKHVALLAAIDRTLDGHERPDFRYADTFAGYARSPLILGGEWKDGIKVLADPARLDKLSGNPHTALWRDWYLGRRPQLLGGFYPGSSLVASDACCRRGKQAALSLWDISPQVVADLMEAYSGLGHSINARPARHTAKAVRHADFILIDPPGLRSQSHPEYPPWSSIKAFLTARPKHQSILLWLPVKAVTVRMVNGQKAKLSPPGEDSASWAARDEAVGIGYGALRVRWATGGRTIGCHLIYSLSDVAGYALQAAVEHVVAVAGWQATLHPTISAITATRPDDTG